MGAALAARRLGDAGFPLICARWPVARYGLSVLGVLVACRKALIMKLTLDSAEPLDVALRVVGALYGVRLAVNTDDAPERDGADQPAPATVTAGDAAGRRASTSRGRRQAGKGGRATSRRRNTRRADPSGNTAEIRAWARRTGLTVSDRGRISGTVLAAYRNAHSH
jgi:hypothetical protein